MNNRGLAAWEIVLLLAAVAALGYGVYHFLTGGDENMTVSERFLGLFTGDDNDTPEETPYDYMTMRPKVGEPQMPKQITPTPPPKQQPISPIVGQHAGGVIAPVVPKIKHKLKTPQHKTGYPTE